MSIEIKVALIGAAATIIAVIIAHYLNRPKEQQKPDNNTSIKVATSDLGKTDINAPYIQQQNEVRGNQTNEITGRDKNVDQSIRNYYQQSDSKHPVAGKNISTGDSSSVIGDNSTMNTGSAGIIVQGNGNHIKDAQAITNNNYNQSTPQFKQIKISNLSAELEMLKTNGISDSKLVQVFVIEKTTGQKFIPQVKELLEKQGYQMYIGEAKLFPVAPFEKLSDSQISADRKMIMLLLGNE